jgi:hypothetical protein
MKRGNFAWANISDGENAIGVWLPVELARQVAYTGSYKAYGDLLQVTGIFNSTCREHGGDLDIHAQGISKISSGRDVLNNVNPEKAKQALALLGILAAVWILTLLKRK